MRVQINKAKNRMNADSFIEELWIFEGDQKGMQSHFRRATEGTNFGKDGATEGGHP